MSKTKKCLYCENLTTNPKFCSMSCAAKHNNTVCKRRQPQGLCKKCQKSIKTNIKYCENCCTKNKDITLAEAIYDKHHKSNSYTLVRSRARAKINKLGITKCSQCGYDKHIEVGHIKPISSFDKSTLLSVINDISNLIVLCPNHHWEFDNR